MLRRWGVVVVVTTLLAVTTPSAHAQTPSFRSGPMCQTAHSGTADATERRVQATLVLGDVVYFGGKFDQVLPPGGGVPVPRNQLAACSLVTGEILPWNPDTEGDSEATGGGDVHALATDGSRIYAGGAFDRVGGVTASGLVALDPDPTDPAPRPLLWGAGAAPGINGSRAVKSLALPDDGRTLYLGGTFEIVNGVERAGIAALETSTGTLLDWDPELLSESANQCPSDDPECVPEDPEKIDVRALVVHGPRVIASGYFTEPGLDGDDGHVAAFDADTGASLPWDWKPDYPVIALSANSSRVYAAGAGVGIRRNTLTALDPSTGEEDWEVYADGNWQAVWATDGIVYGGGHMQACGPRERVSDFERDDPDPEIARRSLCAFAEGSELPLTGTPDVNVVGNGIFALHGSGGVVVAGGAFSGVDGSSQRGLAKFSTEGFRVDAVTPAALDQGDERRTVRITGEAFAPTPVVELGTGVTVHDVSFVSASRIEATVTVSSSASQGRA